MKCAPKALVDLRTYTIRPRAMAEFISVWDQLAMPVQLRTLGNPLGFYKSIVGALNQFVHLWAYESFAGYEQRIILRDRDPDWPAYLKASTQVIVAQQNQLLSQIVMASIKLSQQASDVSNSDPQVQVDRDVVRSSIESVETGGR